MAILAPLPSGTPFNPGRRFFPVLGHACFYLLSYREELLGVGLHGQLIKGISGAKDLGAASIIMSGGYGQDDDEGEYM